MNYLCVTVLLKSVKKLFIEDKNQGKYFHPFESFFDAVNVFAHNSHTSEFNLLAVKYTYMKLRGRS